MTDPTAEVALLQTMPLAELRGRWQQANPRMVLPKGLPRDLLVRGIVWNLQERVHGGLPSATVKQLERLVGQLERSGDLDLERETSLKTGTRLVREWRGRTYRVLVLGQGFLFEDRRYASLSHIARVITGTHWSGPRFFGLRTRRAIKPETEDV